jgi:hypothetical protein
LRLLPFCSGGPVVAQPLTFMHGEYIAGSGRKKLDRATKLQLRMGDLQNEKWRNEQKKFALKVKKEKQKRKQTVEI